jgi:tetratricopeptide (TPR) repeat protein
MIKMGKSTDAQNDRKQWLQAIKQMPLDSLSPEAFNDLARKCLVMGASGDALGFAAKAVELEPDIEERMSYMVTLADAHRASGELAKAFDAYLEAFRVSQRGDASTGVLSDSLSGLARLAVSHPGFVNEKRAELNEVMSAIGDTDSSRLMGYSAGAALTQAGTLGQLVYLSALVLYNGGVSESEGNWLSSPEFIQSIANLSNPMALGWVYEMIGEPTKAAEAYESVLKPESPLAARMIASCALMSLRHSLGEETSSQPHVYLEAEEARSFTPYLEVSESPEASRGRYLWAPDTFDGSHDGKGQAEYEFENPTVRNISAGGADAGGILICG